MKNAKLAVLLFFGITAIAQTSAKRDPVNQVDYEMFLTKPGSSITISTYKSATEQEKSLVFKTSSPNCSTMKGVRLRLSNGEMILYDKIPVECGALTPGMPNVKASVLLTPELEAKLDGQEIVEYSLGQIKTEVKFKEPYENLKSLRRLVKEDRGF